MKGIRAFTNARFLALLPLLRSKEIDGKAFRATVLQDAVLAFGISAASAATHYNHAFKTVKAADPQSVAGLGRAEDKKGGRKPVHVVTVIKTRTGEVVAEGLSRAAAELLITKAAATKKAKLSIKVDAPAEAVTA